MWIENRTSLNDKSSYLNKKGIKTCPLIIALIRKSGLREFGKFPQIVRITSPLWNSEDLKDMASRVLNLSEWCLILIDLVSTRINS